MFQDRLQTAHVLADELALAERDINAAYASITRLMSRLPTLAADAGLSPSVGQPVYVLLARASLEIADGRGAVVDAHHKLDELRRQLRLPQVHAGGPTDKPEHDSFAPQPFGVIEGRAAS